MRQFVFWALLLFITVRVVVITVLGVTGGIDPTFFTYQNFILDTFWLLFLSQAIWSRSTFEWFALFVLPIYWGTTTFVALAIVVIVYLNGGIFVKTSTFNGGHNTIGVVHTGDWILHQWPWVEALLVLLLLYGEFWGTFQNFYYHSGLNKGEKAAYIIYFLTAPLMILAFYMVNFNFLVNYPNEMPEGAIIGLVIGLALLVQAVLVLAMCFLNKPNIFSRVTDMADLVEKQK
jgi:hypothetical protein